ncbi:hypothetical protein [Thermomonas sp.]|uniref:hypothetical protein n=1 Tax=Thermomonas sp. TaxID=1971895 RepID=UPI0026250D16|nr:hypothetical protein [Thermomonas sp.]MCO5055455.1 hypothetical protein [Thermomonas sp.]
MAWPLSFRLRKRATSLTAAALRYAEIGGLPVGIVQCHQGKVEFCAAYPLQKHAGFRARPLIRNAKVPTGSATQRLSSDLAGILRAQEDSETAEGLHWVSGADRNAGLIEEVIGPANSVAL